MFKLPVEIFVIFFAVLKPIMDYQQLFEVNLFQKMLFDGKRDVGKCRDSQVLFLFSWFGVLGCGDWDIDGVGYSDQNTDDIFNEVADFEYLFVHQQLDQHVYTLCFHNK